MCRRSRSRRWTACCSATARLNKIAGVELESLYSAEEMNDNADLVSDVDCLGAIYPGEDAVYDGTDWTAIRDELLLEASGEDDGRLVEQTLVLFDTADARRRVLRLVQGQMERVRAGQGHRGRGRPVGARRGSVDVDERTISLKAKVSGTLEGICQHAMGVVSNLIVEGFSCDVDDNDDAQKIAAQLLEDAAEQ